MTLELAAPPDVAILHLGLTVVGLLAGSVALLGQTVPHSLPRVTALFLAATLAASAAGLLPGRGAPPDSAASLAAAAVLMPTLAAVYRFRLAGRWRWIFLTGATTALWLDALAAVTHAFASIAYLKPLAGTPVVAIADLALLVIFVALGALAAMAR